LLQTFLGARRKWIEPHRPHSRLNWGCIDLIYHLVDQEGSGGATAVRTLPQLVTVLTRSS
jgi:hypothetical protein